MNYRQIYKLFYRPIPKDQDGRSYDIHHIDGDKTNNSILNLIALSIDDHFEVHNIQEDYAACLYISHRMTITPEERSKLASYSVKQRLENGTHKFLDSNWQSQNQHNRVKNNTHPWQNIEYHKNLNLKRVLNKTHNWLGKGTNERMLKEGKHPSQNKIICEICNKTMSKANYIKWKHGKNCKGS